MALSEDEEFELLSLERERAMANQESQVQTKTPYQAVEPQNKWDQVFNVPAAGIRSALQGKGYMAGITNPSKVPKFQDLAIQKAQFTTDPTMNVMLGMPASALGLAADIATNPVDVLSSILPFAPGIKQGISAIAGSKVGQGVKSIVNKDIRKIFSYEGDLIKTEKAKTALDSVRSTLGKAKDLAVSEVADVPAELNWSIGGKSNVSKKLVESIKNPIYGVEFTEKGGVKQTIGNLDKVKTAVGELISSPKLWEEAPKTEQQWIKRFYGQVNQSMKDASIKAGKDISPALNEYSKFMDNYNLVNKRLVDIHGNVMANKLKETFRITAEPAYKQAFKEVSVYSPEIKSIMNERKGKELLKNLLKTSVAVYALKKGKDYLGN